MNRRRRAARLQGGLQPRAWLMRHLQVFFSSLGRLWQRPLGNFMSVLVIAIAMALPAGLHLVVDNLERLSDDWEGAASATLFLQQALDDAKVEALLQRLRREPQVGELKHLTPGQALAEFRRYSGMADAISLLEENPLPHVVLIRPADPGIPAERFRALVERLREYPEVERAVADLQWVERFQGMVHLLQRGTTILAALLSLAVLLVIGNTIRLEIQNRRQEIEIVKLVGGSHAFIRRPFLYEGFWYGLLGATLALLLLSLSLFLLHGPVSRLARLYGSGFTLESPGPAVVLAMLLAGSLLGILGAWIAVRQQLQEIEPT
ncbi:MAG TPA: ABC transporter permease [Thiolapillus brandeum]|uniref:Cell division protein FtsX n=1 Tax=Thiolapillus brandeum TaxID=1076588 RepID=A0A7C5N065_9GAMM|nr:ABC transporter permease [Thiolapillus brandeum]